MEEEKIRESTIFDLNLNYNNFHIIDDIGNELNINIDYLEQENSLNEDIDEESLKNGNSLDNYKIGLNRIEENINPNDLDKADLDEIKFVTKSKNNLNILEYNLKK